MRNKIALAGLVLALGFVNWAIFGKEKHLKEGRVFYLELAPVDPRSLMQGDYMALRFQVAEQVSEALAGEPGGAVADGYVALRLDERGVATFERLSDGRESSGDVVAVRYRRRHGTVKFATNAFFFQEGHGLLYEPARYGQFRADSRGELLLTAMFDEDLNRLGPE